MLLKGSPNPAPWGGAAPGPAPSSRPAPPGDHCRAKGRVQLGHRVPASGLLPITPRPPQPQAEIHLLGAPPTWAGLWAFVSPFTSALCSPPPPSGAPPRFPVRRRLRSGLPRSGDQGLQHLHLAGPPACPSQFLLFHRGFCSSWNPRVFAGRASCVRIPDSWLPRMVSPSRFYFLLRVFPPAEPLDHHRASPASTLSFTLQCQVRKSQNTCLCRRLGPLTAPRPLRFLRVSFGGRRPSHLVACSSSRRSPGNVSLAEILLPGLKTAFDGSSPIMPENGYQNFHHTSFGAQNDTMQVRHVCVVHQSGACPKSKATFPKRTWPDLARGSGRLF